MYVESQIFLKMMVILNTINDRSQLTLQSAKKDVQRRKYTTQFPFVGTFYEIGTLVMEMRF